MREGNLPDPPESRSVQTESQVAPVARVRVAVSLTVATRASRISWTYALCARCKRKVMGVPRDAVLEVRALRTNAERSGRGRVVGCPRCGTLCEVIEHT